MGEPLNADIVGAVAWRESFFDIAIDTLDGRWVCIGHVKGWFGIHEWGPGLWRLSHLPTGRVLAKADDRDSLMRMADDSEFIELMNWGFSDFEGFVRQRGGKKERFRTILARHGATRPSDETGGPA